MHASLVGTYRKPRLRPNLSTQEDPLYRLEHKHMGQRAEIRKSCPTRLELEKCKVLEAIL